MGCSAAGDHSAPEDDRLLEGERTHEPYGSAHRLSFGCFWPTRCNAASRRARDGSPGEKIDHADPHQRDCCVELREGSLALIIFEQPERMGARIRLLHTPVEGVYAQFCSAQRGNSSGEHFSAGGAALERLSGLCICLGGLRPSLPLLSTVCVFGQTIFWLGNAFSCVGNENQGACRPGIRACLRRPQARVQLVDRRLHLQGAPVHGCFNGLPESFHLVLQRLPESRPVALHVT